MSERSTRESVGSMLPGESATAWAAHESSKGERRGLRGLWPFLGPALVAAVACVDPDNFATNTSAGAQYGYLLLWVSLASNFMAMLIQSMLAKLGIPTCKNLPEVCREQFPRAVSLGLWVQAEIIATATDLAEFIGAALALKLLFGIPFAFIPLLLLCRNRSIMDALVDHRITTAASTIVVALIVFLLYQTFFGQ